MACWLDSIDRQLWSLPHVSLRMRAGLHAELTLASRLDEHVPEARLSTGTQFSQPLLPTSCHVLALVIKANGVGCQPLEHSWRARMGPGHILHHRCHQYDTESSAEHASRQHAERRLARRETKHRSVA
jgi:hypothetical protein